MAEVCESYMLFRRECEKLISYNDALLYASNRAEKLLGKNGSQSMADTADTHPDELVSSQDERKKSHLERDIANTLNRGGIISAVAMWEGYIQNILEEAVTAIATVVINEPSKVFKNEGLMNFAKRAIIHSMDEVEFIQNNEALLCLDLHANNKEWKKYVEQYKEKVLEDNLGNNWIPIFTTKGTAKISKHSIDKRVEQILKTEKSISSIMVKQKITYNVPLRIKEKEQYKMTITDEKALHDLTCLYYGARCTFAHGDHTRTFSSGGALSKFPEAKEVLERELDSSDGASYAYDLYTNMGKQGRSANVSEEQLVQLEVTLMKLSLYFYQAIQKIVEDEYGLKIWTKTKVHTQQDPEMIKNFELEEYITDRINKQILLIMTIFALADFLIGLLSGTSSHGPRRPVNHHP